MHKKTCLFLLFLNSLICSFCFSSNDTGALNDTEILSKQEESPLPSLHVLLTTIGRPTLLNMLTSLEDQLISSDYLTIVFDANDQGEIFDTVVEMVFKFQCHCTVIMEPVNLGYWGHAIRNKYNELEGDFVLHGDDDDIYLPNSFSVIRQAVAADLNTLYIFPMRHANGSIITGRPIKHGHIGTPNGVIPVQYNSKAKWGYSYGGDASFYSQLEKIVPQIIYVNFPIYSIRPPLPIHPLLTDK